MNSEILVLLGDFSRDQRMIERVALEFGWSVRQAANQSELREIANDAHVVAVLVNPSAWKRNVGNVGNEFRATMSAAPGSRIVVCYRFRDADRFDDSPAGMFHSLATPLSRSELWQSLGFLSEATSREKNAPGGRRGFRKADSAGATSSPNVV